MESGAYSTLLETVNRKSTVCGPSYDYTDDEDLVQLKDYKRCESPSCQLWCLSGDDHKTRKPTLYYSVLARADEGRILPIHFPISDFMLLFFPRVFQFLSSRERNWQEQQENPNGLGK